MKNKGWIQVTNSYDGKRIFVRVNCFIAVAEDYGGASLTSKSCIYMNGMSFYTKETVEEIHELVEKDSSL